MKDLIYKEAAEDAEKIIEEGISLEQYIDNKKKIMYLETLNKYLEESAFSEFEKYGEKSIDLFGVNIKTMETGVKYDYSMNESWNDMKQEIKKLNDSLKDHEKMLKNLSKQSVKKLDEETGEITTLYKPAKTSKTSLIITI